MFKYLGEDGEINSEYYRLVKNAEHKLYDIELKDGSQRVAFKVKYDNEIGFAYHVMEGNVFHFTSENNIVSQKLQKEFKPAIIKDLSVSDFKIALRDGRNENKEVELLNVVFFNENNKSIMKKGFSGKINETDIIIFRENSKIEYIERDKCISVLLLEKQIKLTEEESKEKELKESFAFLEERKIHINKNDEKITNINLYMLVNEIKRFEDRYGQINEELNFGTLKELSNYIKDKEVYKKELENQNLFKEKFNFDIEVKLEEKDKKATIKITDVNSKELSVLVVDDVFHTETVKREVLFKKYSDDDDYIEEDIDFVFFDLNNEDKKIEIYENGKILNNVSESNYRSIYELIGEKGFSNNLNVGNLENEINEIIYEDLELQLESMSFTKTEWRNFFTNQYTMSDSQGVDLISEKIKQDLNEKRSRPKQQI